MKSPQQLAPAPASRVVHNSYWFALGRQNILATAELNAVFGLKPQTATNSIQKIQLEKDADTVKEYINTLGGTIKIGKEIKERMDENDLRKTMLEQLIDISGKIHFGISFYGTKYNTNQMQKFALRIKNDLKKEKRSVRYINNKTEILSSATVKNNGLEKKGMEFLVLENNGKFD